MNDILNRRSNTFLNKTILGHFEPNFAIFVSITGLIAAYLNQPYTAKTSAHGPNTEFRFMIL